MILENVEIHYPRLHPDHPNKHFDPNKPQWEVQLRAHEKATADYYQTLGIKMSMNLDESTNKPFWRGNVKKFSSGIDGEPKAPPDVVDGQTNVIEDPSTIGNGSIAHLMLFITPSKKDPAKNRATLMGVQVVRWLKTKSRTGSMESFAITQTEVVEAPSEEGKEKEAAPSGGFKQQPARAAEPQPSKAVDFDDDIPF